eukprot:7377484-Prymnesium_polylepis.1
MFWARAWVMFAWERAPGGAERTARSGGRAMIGASRTGCDVSWRRSALRGLREAFAPLSQVS